MKEYCEICKFTPENKHCLALLHEHHVHPRELGGDIESDIMIVCHRCHSLIHVLISDGRIKINLTTGKYTYGETLMIARSYLESNKKRARKFI